MTVRPFRILHYVLTDPAEDQKDPADVEHGLLLFPFDAASLDNLAEMSRLPAPSRPDHFLQYGTGPVIALMWTPHCNDVEWTIHSPPGFSTRSSDLRQMQGALELAEWLAVRLRIESPFDLRMLPILLAQHAGWPLLAYGTTRTEQHARAIEKD